MAHWVSNDGEHVMVSHTTLDLLSKALAPDAGEDLREQARQLLSDLDDTWPSRRTHGVESSSLDVTAP